MSNTRKKQLVVKQFNAFSSDLFVISVDVKLLRLAYKFNESKLSCYAHLFDRKIDHDRFAGIVGKEMPILKQYDYELIVDQHGFYMIYCHTSANGKYSNLVSEMRILLPRRMSRLVEERQEHIELEREAKKRLKATDSTKNPMLDDVPLVDDDCSSGQPDGPSGHEKRPPKMNVIMLGVDSMSLNQLRRSFPLTYAYMSESLEHNVIFENYHNVAENTYGNLLALLTGMIAEGNQDLNMTGEVDQFVRWDGLHHDLMPFVWKEYERMGYLTSYSEEAVKLGAFLYIRDGFRWRLTAYYDVPFWTR